VHLSLQTAQITGEVRLLVCRACLLLPLSLFIIEALAVAFLPSFNVLVLRLYMRGVEERKEIVG